MIEGGVLEDLACNKVLIGNILIFVNEYESSLLP
jgi:hypothetical protein